MKNRLHKLFSFLGTALLGLLGFSSCGSGLIDGGDLPDLRVEYGTPNCNFKVDITVVDESGKSLEGIKVIPAGIENKSGGLSQQDVAMLRGKDTLSTDGKGRAVHTYRIFSSPEQFKIYFEDMDGDLNGGFFAKDSAEFTPVKTGEGKGWYRGEWTVSGKKTLKKK